MPVQQQQKQEPSSTKTNHHQPRVIKKFEFHTQAKSTNVLAANQQEKKEQEQLLKEAKEKKRQEEQEKLTNPHYYQDKLINKKPKKSVHFDPFFLERVVLFTEEQEPIQLQRVTEVQPRLRLLCPFWPSKPNPVMVVNKRWFSVEKNFAIKGSILVRNLALDKLVSVRYTMDNWKTVHDVEGLFFGPYIKNPAFDVYEFVMLEIGLRDAGEMRGKIELAIQVTADGIDYWDNNNGLNYQIRIISDPLNDPHYLKKQQQEQQDVYLLNTATTDDDDDDDQEEAYYRDGSDEKHSSFTDALKGYQHAKPAHLRKRQPWLGTRYDFSHSLSIAKGEHSDEEQEKEEEHHFFIKPVAAPVPPPDLLLLTPSSSSDLNDHLKPVFINYSAPPSPVLSPTLDVDSTYYLDLLNKYCFYNGNDDENPPVKKS
ncbi:carbohydrate-binding module family 21 protein [Backusella circina FSU 941]|nr:carbohydrate-binding module family 21 protein [Backusella circina FSU 941]